MNQTIGVAGLGLLGRGIAGCLLAHGFKVIGYTRSSATRTEAGRYIGVALADLIERARFPPALASEWPCRYLEVDSLQAFGDCDFVIETIAEDLEAKNAAYDQIENVVKADVPIASNTSAIPISHLQKHRKHPERFLGMHWAEPAHATRFLELIRGEKTSD